MTVVVTIEGVAVALLALLVGGLLRSYADILRRLHHLNAEGALVGAPEYPLEPGVPPPRDEKTQAFDLIGTTPDGDAVKVAVLGTGESTILAFLSSGCLTCARFWADLRDVADDDLGTPNDASVVVVTKGPENESPARIRDLAPQNLRVIMSSAAWEDYKVPVPLTSSISRGLPSQSPEKGLPFPGSRSSRCCAIRSRMRDCFATRTMARSDGDARFVRACGGSGRLRENAEPTPSSQRRASTQVTRVCIKTQFPVS